MTEPLERARAGSLGVLTALVAACGGAGGERGDPRPDVVLVVVDTLRADRLGCYGYERETSPALDRFAAEGVRYARAFSQAPWTTPSIGSLMTSRFPTELGIFHERSILSEDEVLLAEALAAGGYETAAVVSHSFCSSEWNFDQGFERFDESNVLGHEAVTSAAVTERALELLDGFGRGPFFLWVHYFDPHFAYVFHDEFPFPGPPDYRGPVRDGMKYSLLRGMHAELTATDLEEVRRFYDSEVAETDHWIGALLDGLRARGLWDDALVIVTADHGEEFNDHGAMGHSRTLYQELVHVPLIVKYPRGAGPAGLVDERAVALLDVYPTVLELAGLPAPAGLAGASLLAPAQGSRPLVSETARRGGLRSLVSGDYKLIQHLSSGEIELYDLAADPLERRDLSAADPARAEALRAQLEAWAGAVRPGRSTEVELDREDVERLEALGYTGDE